MEQYINKVIQGDCLEVMKDIPDKSIDMVLTSPPYDNLRDYKNYSFDFKNIAKELFRITKDGGVIVWIVNDATVDGGETGTSFKQALYFKEIGFNLHDTMIWLKDSPAYPASKKSNRYSQVFEYMFIFSKGKPKTTNLIQDRKNKWGGQTSFGATSSRKTNGDLSIQGKHNIQEFGYRFNVWIQGCGWMKSYTDKFLKGHPAIFPEKLAEDHILSWSNEGDIILDPMAGSGTTLKMAKKNNRNYIGIEISPEYIDIINKRLSQLTQDNKDTNPKE